MKKFAFLATIFAILATCSIAKTIDDTKIGFRSNLIDDDLAGRNFEFKQATAGESKMIERSFENAPPLISHDIEDFIPITTDNNSCLVCHMPEYAAELNATAVPRTHLIEMVSGKYLDGKLSQERFNCTQCHVTQSNAKPLIKNTFKANFRNKESKKSSNLAEILNQGVK